MSAQPFRRRHTTSLAVQVTDGNLAEVAGWVNGSTWGRSVIVPTTVLHDGQWRPGERAAAPGQWVVRLPDSRLQVLSDDEFRTEWMVAR